MYFEKTLPRIKNKNLHVRKRACRRIVTTQKGLPCMYNVSVSVIRIIDIVTESIYDMDKKSFVYAEASKSDLMLTQPLV